MRIFWFVFALFFALPAFADAPIVRASLVAKTTGIVASENLQVGLLLEPKEEGWHTYYKDPGDAGLATSITWTLPEGFVAGEIQWPPYHVMDEDGIKVNAYDGRVFLPVDIIPPQGIADTGAPYVLKAKAQWLVCKEICIPESAELELSLPVVAAPAPLSPQADLFAEKKEAVIESPSAPVVAAAVPPAPAQPTFVLTLLFALLGGLILNLMPCVLPVLTLKAFALVKKAGSNPAQARAQGVAYTLGVMLSFALIAGVLISLQQAGEAVGWGYQMQSPAFVGFLIFLLFIVGFNLSGAFELPVLLGHTGGRYASESSARGSFFTGVLATAVATPCTAPFMASAVGVALTLAPWQAMLVFLSLGLGLALPFLLISFCPPLLRLLPKPGAWMNGFKHVLAFAMYGSVIWLLWVLTLQVGAGGMVLALSAMLLMVFALLFIRHNIFALLLIIATVAGALSLLSEMEMQSAAVPPAHAKHGVETADFSMAKIEELRAEGKTVFVDATAAWCITCQVNGRGVIHTQAVMEAFKAHNVVLVIADWTSRNPEITNFLASFGYNGVPLYVMYPPQGEPKVLPQILTQEIVISAIP
ncbi:MAG: hypothetical protein EBR02_06730 [Alphaproteobacteria bacterium]|nr:hypothetical protein [Alphaproteobacteria bacterium]